MVMDIKTLCCFLDSKKKIISTAITENTCKNYRLVTVCYLIRVGNRNK